MYEQIKEGAKRIHKLLKSKRAIDQVRIEAEDLRYQVNQLWIFQFPPVVIRRNIFRRTEF